MPSLSPSPQKSSLSLKRPRPSRLLLAALAAPGLGVPAPVAATRTPPPLSPISPNDARLCCRGTAKRRQFTGGFDNFAASYPQYCESKCPAFSEHCRQPMVEPSYSSHQGPTQLLSFLFVGSQADATDAEVMKRHGITHVLNVSTACPQSQHVPEANFLRVSVNDGYSDKLMPHFKRAFQFIENVRLNSGRCLVHCLAGVSRSPTLTIAYIMQHKRMSQDEAYRYVKSRRPSISPNFNFLGQLLEFERQLKQRTATGESPLADDADADTDCPEAKRQRFFHLRPPAAQSPTSALSQLSFAQQQQQAAAATAATKVSASRVDGAVGGLDHQLTVVAPPCSSDAADGASSNSRHRRPRPRSVAYPPLWLAPVAASAAASATTATAATRRSQSSEGFLEFSTGGGSDCDGGGSKEIACS